jgi:hypothetical protein
MSAVIISDAVFERDMANLHLSLGELCSYGQWHKEDPTKPLREMIRHMTKIREEHEVEANKRAVEDWAFDEEQEAKAKADDNIMPCLYCDEPVPYGICDPCQHAMDEYGAIQCVHCEAGWTSFRTPPCVKCHPSYIADFRAAEAKAVASVAPAAAASAGSTSDDEDMGWYKAKKAEWAAYAAELEAESKRPAPEEEEEDDE